MPLIDVTDMLYDPDYADYLVVYRRSVTTGNNGLQIVTSTLVEPQPIGVVVPQNDAPVFRGPDQQRLPRLIQVYTPFMLQGPSQKNSIQPSNSPSVILNYLPDIIEWTGDSYIVNKVVPWGRWGAGFVVADCSSIDSVDQPPRRWDEDDV